eukprot:COSAG01_NODE_64061_length_278_cov_0.536313_1_plen_28_part_01
MIAFEFVLTTAGGNVNGAAPWTDIEKNP